MRVTRGTARHARHKKVRDRNKGYRGMRRTTFKKGKEGMMKAGQHAYRDRKLKKADFRGLWILRLNAAVREHGISYSRFIKLLKDKKVVLNRKALSELAIHDPKVFAKIVETVK